MKRFKDDNSTKIVTAQLGWLRSWINKVRSLKTPASLGQSEITGMSPAKAPKIPNLVDDWKNVNNIMKGKPQSDEIEAMAKVKLYGGAGVAVFIGDSLVKLPFLKMTGLNYLGAFLTVGQAIAGIIIAAKPHQRALFMQAGGGIYDKIKNIYETQYTLKKFEKVKIPAATGIPEKFNYLPAGDESLTLDEITNLLIESKKIGRVSDSSFEINGFLYHFKNQSDVDEINHMLKQLIKDDKTDESFTKKLAPLGVAASVLGSFYYKNISDYRKNNPTTKNIKRDELGQPKSITQSTPEERKKAQEELDQMLGIPGNRSNTGFKGKNR
jgi:hypothetical protein